MDWTWIGQLHRCYLQSCTGTNIKGGLKGFLAIATHCGVDLGVLSNFEQYRLAACRGLYNEP